MRLDYEFRAYICDSNMTALSQYDHYGDLNCLFMSRNRLKFAIRLNRVSRCLVSAFPCRVQVCIPNSSQWSVHVVCRCVAALCLLSLLRCVCVQKADIERAVRLA